MNAYKQRKRIYIGAAIGIVCVVLIFIFLSSLGRGHGDIGFEAEIVSVEGNWITAKVTKDWASSDWTSFFSKKLPNEIKFDSAFSGVSDLKPGDFIRGIYLDGTIDGNQVKVATIIVLQSSP